MCAHAFTAPQDGKAAGDLTAGGKKGAYYKSWDV